jgi:hypothetical protein
MEATGVSLYSRWSRATCVPLPLGIVSAMSGAGALMDLRRPSVNGWSALRPAQAGRQEGGGSRSDGARAHSAEQVGKRAQPGTVGRTIPIGAQTLALPNLSPLPASLPTLIPHSRSSCTNSRYYAGSRAREPAAAASTRRTDPSHAHPTTCSASRLGQAALDPGSPILHRLARAPDDGHA